MSNDRRYLLGTGYTARSKMPISANSFLNIWLGCIRKHANPRPQEIVIVGDDSPRPYVLNADNVLFLRCHGNLGHVRDKDEGRTKHYITGWAASMLTAAMIAYNSELDYIFQEQDCLGFGPYIEQLYADLGDGMMTIGRPPGAPHFQLPSSQSLFIVRHAYIPFFVRDYLASGEDISVRGKYAEDRFYGLHTKDPTKVRVTGKWNMDRARPIAWDSSVLAVQQWTLPEIEEAEKRNLFK